MLSGAVYDATKSYNDSFYFGGGLILLAGIISCLIPLAYRIQSYLNSSRRGSPTPKILSSSMDRFGETEDINKENVTLA